MELFKNGFVVAEINTENFAYNAWPLHELSNDKIAVELTDEAYDNWYIKYNMQQIIPDTKYIKSYLDYCNSINLQVKVLLFETPYNNIVTDGKYEICEVLGFDCIGTVYYSYLQDELDACMSEFSENNITPNKYRLLDNLEDVLFFIKSRKEVIASGINLEDFWEELPVRISIVNIL